MTARAILAGLGGQGLGWAQALKTRKDISIVAMAEPVEANRKRAIDQLGVSPSMVFESIDEAIDKIGADFVFDVTPPSVHHQVADKAFSKGLHVIGEKPLSDDFAQAKRIASVGASKGLVHMITQNYRFGPQPRATRQLIAQNTIGELGQLDIRFYMSWADIPGSHYVTQPYMLINDMMVHHFDMMRYVLGKDPISVQAITWNPSWGWHKGDASHAIVFEFEGNLHATHVCVGCAQGSMTNWNGDWRIEGTKGTIDWRSDGSVWHSWRHRTPEPFNREVMLPSVKDARNAILDEFLAAIKEKRQPECSAIDNLKSVEMVFAAIKSAKEKRAVKISELA